MKDIGEKAQLARILGAGVILLLVLWTFLSPPTRAQAAQPAAQKPILATDLFIRRTDKALDFRWDVPPQIALEPTLFRRMRSTAEADYAREHKQATAALADARRMKFSEYQWSLLQRWSLEHMSGPLLVLSGELYEFSGGAHGNPARAARILDRATGNDIPVNALFTDWKAVEPRLQALWCTELARLRTEKRGSEPSTLPDFNACPALKELVVYPSGDPAIRSLKAVANPYLAGPYSEGFYEAWLQLDPDLLKAVKPQYRAAFAKP